METINPDQLTINQIMEYEKNTVDLNQDVLQEPWWGEKYVLVVRGKGNKKHVECHKLELFDRIIEFFKGNLFKNAVVNLLNKAIKARDIPAKKQKDLQTTVNRAFSIFKKKKV